MAFGKDQELLARTNDINPDGLQLISKRSEMFLPDQQLSYSSGAKDIDICFVCSPLNWSAVHLPYHYLYLGAWLDKEKLTYQIIDERLDNFYLYKIKNAINKKDAVDIVSDKIIKRLKKIKPKLVGFAVYTSDYTAIMKLAERIKQEIDTKIVVGNAHASIAPQDFIFPGSPVDYVVIGEGELTLAELIQKMKSNESLEDVAGMAFLKDNAFFLTKRRNLLEKLDMPRPAYGSIDMRGYIQPTIYKIRYLLISCVDIYTGRGCPFRCEFCAANTVWKTHGSLNFVRYRPIDNVIEEITYLKKTYGIDAFYVMDDTFTMRKDRVYEFCQKLKEANLGLIWAAETRVNLIDDDLVRTMKDAGCIQLDFGVESGSQKCLDEMQKAITVEQVKAAFLLCKKHGIRTFANMLVNIPHETEADIEASDALLNEIRPTESGFSITTPFPGTALYEKYVNPKLTKEEYPQLFDSRLIETKRFRLCSHSLNLTELRERMLRKHSYSNNTPSLYAFISHERYRRAVSKSIRKTQYLKEAILLNFNSFAKRFMPKKRSPDTTLSKNITSNSTEDS